MKNYTGKNDTEVKSMVRTDFLNVLLAAVRAEYGEENVKQVDSSEYGVIVGTTNVEGSPNEIVVTISPTIKDWKDRQLKSGLKPQYILADAASEYIDRKAEKEAEKAAEKAAREARKKKAAEEKAAKKNEKVEAALNDTGEEEAAE